MESGELLTGQLFTDKQVIKLQKNCFRKGESYLKKQLPYSRHHQRLRAIALLQS
jgi:hypothetical protein